jgi:hypothetical protein
MRSNGSKVYFIDGFDVQCGTVVGISTDLTFVNDDETGQLWELRDDEMFDTEQKAKMSVRSKLLEQIAQLDAALSVRQGGGDE